MELSTPNSSTRTRLSCAALGILVAMGLASSPAEALPLSRFTERVTGPLINEFGEDPNLPETIIVSRAGFFGKAVTGGGGAVAPGHQGGPFAEAILDSPDGGIVSAFVTYHFGVVGPPGPAPIPLLIDALILVEVEHELPDIDQNLNSDRAAIEVFGVGGTGGGDFSVHACGGLPLVCRDRRWDLVIDLGLPVGAEGTITLQAGLGGHPLGFRRALADPLIRVDPSFPDADLYRIVVGSNVSNAPVPGSAVPESSSMSLVWLGVLALALARLKRRRSTAARIFMPSSVPE